MGKVIIFRAMCLEEYERTLRLKTPDFSLKRFKYFALSLDFIKERVLDGVFNNSKFKKERYVKCLSFSLDEKELKRCRASSNELEVDRRKNVSIQLLSEVAI
jgi:hypothetical protein